MFNLTPWKSKRLPIRHEEQHPVYTLQREMNSLFDNFFGAGDWFQYPERSGFGGEQSFGEIAPRVDVSETDKELLVKVELPGMTEKDVEVSIANGLLTIKGEKKQEKEENEKGWYRMERQYGSFSRSLMLPYEIQDDKAEALYKHGVLTIKMPKAVTAGKETKSIAVKSV